MREYLEIFSDVIRLATLQYRPGRSHAEFPMSGDRLPSRRYVASPSRAGGWPNF